MLPKMAEISLLIGFCVLKTCVYTARLYERGHNHC